MPTNYPAALDTATNLIDSQAYMDSVPEAHNIAHDNPRDAILAIEAAVGPTSTSFLVQRFASQAARDAAIPSPVAGMKCWQTDIGLELTYDGTGWKATQEAATAITTNATGEATISFPVAFTAAPVIQHTVESVATGFEHSSWIEVVTAASFRINVFFASALLDTGSRTIHWAATGYVS